MTKKHIWALVLIGLCAIVLILNTRGSKVSVNLIVDTFSAVRSLVFLAFIAIGVVIGVLFK